VSSSVSTSGAAGIGHSLGGESRARKIKVEDFLLFNQQMSALLRAGLPILQAIGILRKRVANDRLRLILEDVEEKIRAGQALSQAFAAQGDAFPRIYIASILAGERSGSLDTVLLRYVSYQKTINDAMQDQKSLAYPMVLVSVDRAGDGAVHIRDTSSCGAPRQRCANSRLLVTVMVVTAADFISGNLTWLIPTIIGVVIFLLY
jgi:type IV pilus assembly protein PilC